MARNIMWLLIVSGCAIGVSAVTVICFALDWFGKTYSESFDFKELQSRKGDVSRNIREIVAALKKYEMANGEMPYDITEKNKKPLLSWRVSLLPILGESELYKKFKLDEPWDSEHNKKLAGEMPRVYFYYPCKNQPDKTPLGFTPFCRLFSKKMELVTVQKDDDCILVVESAAPVCWTQPNDILIDHLNFEPIKLGNWRTTGGYVGYLNASAEFVDSLDNTRKRIISSADLN